MVHVVLIFPQPPNSKTLIAQPDCDSSVVTKAQTVLAKVRKVLTDAQTDLSLEEVLVKADIRPDEYTEALAISRKGEFSGTHIVTLVNAISTTTMAL